MAQIVQGFGCSSGSASTTDCEIDCTGAVDGDTLIFNIITVRFEPYSQAGNTSQSAFGDLVSAAVGLPIQQLP